MYLFYTPQLHELFADKASDNTSPLRSVLSEEESAHCVRVLRYQKGDSILLTDGCGTTYDAVVTNPNPRCCEFEVVSAEKQKPSHNFYLHIAIAPTKNIERLEWMVEKSTEIGVDEITPLLCHYSERRQIRLDRLEKIILSACKQSLTPYMPRLNPLTDIREVITNANEQTRFIAHCYKEQKSELKDNIKKGASCLVLIGPEGDFSMEEVELALSRGFVPVSLGNSRLRTETAGIVACHTAVLMNE